MIKLGMIGLDTSHSIAFAKILNKTGLKFHIPGGLVTAAYPGGSRQFHLSKNRVKGLTEQITDEFDIEIIEDVPTLVKNVDAVLLLSADGRQHLEQFEQAAVGKPVFIDKPFTTCLEDAKRMVDLAEKTHTPIMSCSSLRFASGVSNLLDQDDELYCCEAFGPAPIFPDYPGLFWYGIHTVEILFHYLGKSCQSVSCQTTPGMDVILGKWDGDRYGVMRGHRFKSHYHFGCLLHTNKCVVHGLAIDDPPFYYLLLKEVMRFFSTGISPVEIEETLRIIAFIEMADQSKRDGYSHAVDI